MSMEIEHSESDAIFHPILRRVNRIDSDTSLNNEDTENNQNNGKVGRKRSRNPGKWSRNVEKQKRIQDTCAKCDYLVIKKIYNRDEEKNAAEVEHDEHLRNAEIARNSMAKDRLRASDEIHVFSFDLERALPFPHQWLITRETDMHTTLVAVISTLTRATCRFGLQPKHRRVHKKCHRV
ncbi:hypothetical protein TNCV_3604901 [Trichonephila clavipes]|nr:hypothetical protein TNCV_3604901 [Trichonephila clavipes]